MDCYVLSSPVEHTVYCKYTVTLPPQYPLFSFFRQMLYTHSQIIIVSGSFFNKQLFARSLPPPGSKRKLEKTEREAANTKMEGKDKKDTGEREYIHEREEMKHNRETEDRNIKIERITLQSQMSKDKA